MARTSGRPIGRQVRRRLGQGLALVGHSDLALLYSGVVVVVAVVLATLPEPVHDAVVLNCSTNLENLRLHPVWVLVVSAFVLSSLAGLWLVPFLAVAVAAGQRWLGRAPVVFAGVVGHVGATLLVAVLLATGIVHGRLAASVAHEPDVGISYVLACLAGLLTVRVPPRWRQGYVAALVLYFVGPLLLRPTFTALGHTTALASGLGLALLAARTAQAARRSTADPAAPGPQPRP